MESKMFEALDEEIVRTEGGSPATKDRLVRFATAVVVALLVFGGLWLGIIALE